MSPNKDFGLTPSSPNLNINRNSVTYSKVSRYDEFLKFNPSQTSFHDDPAVNGYGYVFITRPDLNFTSTNILMQDNAFYNFFHEMSNSLRGEHILASLSDNGYNGLSPSSPFIPLLSSRVNQIPMQDTVLKEEDVSETRGGYRIKLPGTSSGSTSGGNISLSFRETQNLDVIKLHKVWIDYMELIRRGFFPPKDTYVAKDINRIIDYVSSIYYFRTLPDGQTLTYYAKYTGVFPTSIPYSTLSFEKGNNEVASPEIAYSSSFKEDLDPEILRDFNHVVGLNSNKSIKTPRMDSLAAYNANLSGNSGKIDKTSWTESPIVTTKTVSGNKEFFLQFV